MEPLDPISPLFPSSVAGYQRPLHTLRLNPVVGSSQPGLVFNSQPSVSSRGAGSAPGMPPRNSSRTGRRGSPTGGQPPAGDPSPWFPRHLGEQMLGRMDQILDMVTSRDEWSYGEQREFAYSRWRSPLRRVRVPSFAESAPPYFSDEMEAPPPPEWRHPPPRTPRRERSRPRPSQVAQPVQPPPPGIPRR